MNDPTDDSALPNRQLIADTRDLLRDCTNIVSFTGAGLSAESGVSTFRDSQQRGLWDNHDPTRLASQIGFADDAELVMRWYGERRRQIANAEPNAAHRALAARSDITHVTQNVDDLLHRAGATEVAQLHGTIAVDRCNAACGFAEPINLLDPPSLRPCPACGDRLRPGVVWFGESLPTDVWTDAERACAECDALLVVGTSAVVYPAAGLIALAHRSGAAIIIVNTQRSGASALADIELIGPAGELVPALLAANENADDKNCIIMTIEPKTKRKKPKSAVLKESKTRVERDSMGEMTVPADALYGATTQRAVLNFPVSGRPVPPQVIHAFALLKKACAEANHALDKLDQKRTKLIVTACDEIILAFTESPAGPDAADMMRHFPIDIFQTGSGTSTNMNVNEVVSNLACRAAGKKIGAKDPIHPNDHVNMGQSSNDTFPTAMQIAAAIAIKLELLPALKTLTKSLKQKARKWDKHVKIGRTHLMDATPIRVGQEFSGFAAQTEYAVTRAERAINRLAENLPLGGTAVGTGLNTHPKFGANVARRLSKATSVKFSEAENHFEAQATRDCVVEASGELKTIAVSLSKIANDIRLLGSGPRCGLFELSLPATQPGSSIMPGKVNPVICESVMQVACQVIGNDAAITIGAMGGVGSLLQLNVAMPMMAANLIDNVTLLANAATILNDNCIKDLELNKDIATGMVEKSLMMCTSLAPEIGYDNAAKVAKAAFKENKTIREYVLEHDMLDEDKLNELLDASSMTEPSA